MNKTSCRAVLVTVPNRKIAQSLARGLIKKRLAACVNVVPGLISHYRWQGKLCVDHELLLIIKTRAALFPNLKRFVRENHPAQVPEIISLPIFEGDKDYLAWIAQSTRA